jgi:hypothetical protein
MFQAKGRQHDASEPADCPPPPAGQAVVQREVGRPQRLQPGAVIGLDLMLKRQPSPAAVTTDPNFPAHIVSLSRQKYEQALGNWASQQVRTERYPRSYTQCLLSVS